MITTGTRIRFRPSGWGEPQEHPGVKIPGRVTGAVTYVTDRLCVVEAEYDGVTIRECFGIYRGELRDKSLEVLR